MNEIIISPHEVKIDEIRTQGSRLTSGYKGIRITHIPTGIIVESLNDRSQYRNRDKAFKILRSKLQALLEDQFDHNKDFVILSYIRS